MRIICVICLLLVLAPVWAVEVSEDVLIELESILTLYEIGSAKIEQGLLQVETGLIQSEAAQTTLQKRLDDLEKHWQSYERAAEGEVRRLKCGQKALAWALGAAGSVILGLVVFLLAGG